MTAVLVSRLLLSVDSSSEAIALCTSLDNVCPIGQAIEERLAQSRVKAASASTPKMADWS